MHELITQRWQEIEPLLEAVLDVAPDERTQWLREHCPDEGLRGALLKLIRHDSDEGMIARLCNRLGWGEADRDQHKIGAYRVLRRIGQGGMAIVFLAERETAGFAQLVALKLMGLGVYSRDEQILFQREQRIHARLEHPHIARVLDSGITPTGVPYFAMEFVAGAPITTWCDARRLDIKARLRLFIAVCEAVQYAHQNLIVHRDLKPSNILVTDDGTPKLLDFGIAKLLRDSDGGEQTRTAVQRLTPGYAAPEQFAGGTITTATDVYALGVLLHELLTGVRPQPTADGGTLPASSCVQNMSAADAVTTAAAHATDPTVLLRTLRGDLDSLIAKALQPAAERRYTSAAAFSDDIKRHLSGQPILARPDALLYRAGKYCRRHIVGMSAAAGVAVILIVATVVSVQQAVHAQAQAIRASAEAARANVVTDFLQGLFDSASPGATTVDDADQLLALGAARATRDLTDRPELQVRILGIVGNIQMRRGHLTDARDSLDKAAQTAQLRLGATDERTLEMASLLALVEKDQGQYAEAAQRLEQALQAYYSVAHDASTAEVDALQALATLHARRYEDDAAIDYAKRALQAARRLPTDASITSVLTTLGDVQASGGHYEEAIPPLREALARIRAKFGNEHANVAEALAELAEPLRRSGQLQDAEALLQESTAIDRKAYSQPNQRAAVHLNDLAATLAIGGKLDRAADTMWAALDMYRKIYPPDHPNIANTVGNLGVVRFMQGRHADAEGLLRQEIAMESRTRHGDDLVIARTKLRLARVLVHMDKLAEAQELLEKIVTQDTKNYPEPHEYLAEDLLALSELAAARGDYTAAIEHADHALRQYERLLPALHYKITEARLALAADMAANDRFADAREQYSTALRDARTAHPPIPATISKALVGLARVDLAQGATAQARTTLSEAQALLDSHESSHVALSETITQLLAKTGVAAR